LLGSVLPCSRPAHPEGVRWPPDDEQPDIVVEPGRGDADLQSIDASATRRHLPAALASRPMSTRASSRSALASSLHRSPLVVDLQLLHVQPLHLEVLDPQLADHRAADRQTTDRQGTDGTRPSCRRPGRNGAKTNRAKAKRADLPPATATTYALLGSASEHVHSGSPPSADERPVTEQLVVADQLRQWAIS
jgi:hypothetical protein